MQPHTVGRSAPLLEYLFAHFPDFKKTRVRQLLKFGSVAVNGTVTTAHAHPLKPGDRLTFLSKDAAQGRRIRAQLPFPLIFEDADLVVIDKPSGLLTMGTEKDKIHTAYYELTDYVRRTSPSERARIFIVHRLDRDASGLVVFAKNAETKELLQGNWDQAVKRYEAVVEGHPEKPSGKIESYLVEDKFRRVYSISERSRDAKHASTLYRVIERGAFYSRLEATLLTGRKNQIRVHLSDLGCPIAGDAKYGSQSDPAGRLLLHASFLAFKHPRSGEPVSFRSEPPAAFADALRTSDK